jgi:hypothetical protein
MSRTLVISDNNFLNVLYPLNLEVYLATEVVIAQTFTESSALLKKFKYDLIISLSSIKGKDSLEEMDSFLKSYGIKTPLIIVGKTFDEMENKSIYGLHSKFDIRALLKKGASILNVTAKQMAEMKMGEYYGIKLASLESLQNVPCPIFWHVENQHKILAHRDDSFSPSYKTALASGTEKVYVRSSDRLVLINSLSLTIVGKISDALKNSENETTEKKVELLSEGYEFAALNLFSNEEIKQDLVKIANASTKVMNDVVKDSPHLKGLLSTLMSNQSGYIFTHSMIACYVASHIIKNVTWGGEGQGEKINFVLFFHDIYLAPLYLKYPHLAHEGDLLLSREISEKEKDTFLNHAKLAAELVVTYKRCPMGADLLIKQHHGMKKGSGFALKFPEDLSPLAKILVVAEAFVEQFLICHKEGRKPEMKIIIPKLVEEFGAQSYIKIVQTLVDMPL